MHEISNAHTDLLAVNTCGHRVLGCSKMHLWFLGQRGLHLFYNMATVGWQTVICLLAPNQANELEVSSPKSTSLWPQLANTKQSLCNFFTPDVKHCMRHQGGWCNIRHILQFQTDHSFKMLINTRVLFSGIGTTWWHYTFYPEINRKNSAPSFLKVKSNCISSICVEIKWKTTPC